MVRLGGASVVSDDSDETIVNSDIDDDVTRIVVRKPQQALAVGDVVRERFVVEKMLGEGGMGQVFLAVDRQAEKSNPYVALKLLGGDFKEHPQAFAALRREAMQSRRLTHPNIVAVYDFDRTDDHVYMVMEYLKGGGLDDFIANHPEGNPLATVWPLILGCGEGLEYVHQQNIVHADFKPSNVFVTEDAEVKVLDLGIARTLDESQAESGTTRFDPDELGALTPQYASCEMFEGVSPTPQDDLYALACVAYELLTGQHPYKRRAAIEARANGMEVARPDGLKNRQWKALQSALAMRRADRPESVQAFLDELNPEQKRSSPLPWIAVSAIVLVIAGVQAFLQFRVDDDDIIQGIMEQYPVQLEEIGSPEEMLFYEDMSARFAEMGVAALNEGDYERAQGLFVGTPSSAFKSYREILNRSDDVETRWRAAAGVLAILRHYETALIGMKEAGWPIADRAETACSALTLAREPRLEDLLHEMMEEDEAKVLDVSDCRNLVDSGRLAS